MLITAVLACGYGIVHEYMMDAFTTALKTGTELSFGLGMHIRRMLTPRFVDVASRPFPEVRADIVAGLTVASVIIPNSMAYALLVGLPPQMGLYASLPAVAIGTLWGSSAFVVTGAVGVVSLLTLTAVLPFASMGSPAFATLAIALALAVGLIQLAAGLFQLGYLARLVPHSVLMGFSSAAALIIALTQVPSLLGLSVAQREHVIDTILAIVREVPHMHIATSLIGIATIVFLVALRRVAPMVPAALIALVCGVAASVVFSFDALGIARVGEIPSRLPVFDIPTLSFTTLTTLLSSAFVIALVGFMETAAIARSLAKTTRERHDPDREFVGQGLANIGSGLLGGFPVSGSFSASAVNVSAGARSALSTVVVALAILVAILFLAPILSYLPKVILAAIVIAAVIPLVDLNKMRDAFTLSTSGGIIAALTFVLAFLFKPDVAVIAGVVIALIVLVHKIMFADVVEVGFDHEWSDTLHAAGTKPSIETLPGLLMVRVDRSILYANSERIMERMRRLVAARSETPRLFVISFAGVNEVDFSGLEDLGDFTSELRAKGTDIGIVYAKKRERDTLRRAHDVVGPVTFLHSIDELKARYELVMRRDGDV